MASTNVVEPPDTSDGLPRRRAIQGIAGSLAGITALGAMSASGKKNKKGKKGTLAKFETVQDSEDFGTVIGTPTTASVTCPAPSSKEAVYVVGGGFSVEGAIVPVDFSMLASEPTDDGQGWTATVLNGIITPKTLTVTAICAYFKTK